MHRLNALRRIRYAVTLLLIIMALFVTVESNVVNNVYSGSLQLNPTHAFTGADVGVSGSLTSTTAAVISTCTISGNVILGRVRVA